MPAGPELRTARLVMRRWHEADHEPFAALNDDPQVMQYFPARLTRAESDRMIAGIEAEFDQHGYGFWALELRTSGEFLGCTGLARVTFDAHFTPAVDIRWRLARAAWGHGYATEAARAALAFGFTEAGLEEIVALTTAANARSRAVMERIGMARDPAEDFEHPRLARGDALRPHVLYRISLGAVTRPARSAQPGL